MEKLDSSLVDQILIRAEIIGDSLEILSEFLDTEGCQGRISSSQVDLKSAALFVARLPAYMNLLYSTQDQVRMIITSVNKAIQHINDKEEKTA